MSKLEWDKATERAYEAGVERVALYTIDKATGNYNTGVAWNGCQKINENPSGGESEKLYADNKVYAVVKSVEEFGFTIEAYMYPKEWEGCDGSAELTSGVVIGQQTRNGFGLAYITKIGNDTEDLDHGEKLHLIYGATANPSSKDYETINESPNLVTFSYDCETVPVEVAGHKPTAHLTVDSRNVDSAKWDALIELVYGAEAGDPTLPLPALVLSTLAAG